jgi:predicted dehydrogenase
VVELWLKHVRQTVARAPTADEVDDWVVIPALVFFNSVLPSYYRMGSLAFRECVQQEIVKACGMDVDELAFFQISAMTVGPAPAVQYRLFDATTGPRDKQRAVSVSIPFSVLEAQHSPTTLQLSPDWIQQGPAPTTPSVGVLGTGWGLQVQVPGFRVAGLKVVAIYSRSKERAHSVAQEHGIAQGFDSVDKLCTEGGVDLVSCVGPASTRCSQVLTVLQHGKNVLVDKPMGLSEAQGLKILEAARATPSSRAWMDFELRCVPAVVKMRALLSSGDFGGLVYLNIRCLMNWGFMTDPSSHWKYKELGGGAFAANGPHYIDLARFVTGQEVARVSASQHLLPNDEADTTKHTGADCMTTAVLQMVEVPVEVNARKLPVNILISARTPGAPPENEFFVCCERGSMRLNLLDSTLSIYRDGSKPQRDGSGGNPFHTVGCKAEEFGGGGNAFDDVGIPALGRTLRAALAGDAGPAEPGGLAVSDLATLVDGCIAQRVSDAVELSASQGGMWVDVSSTTP